MLIFKTFMVEGLISYWVSNFYIK